MLKSLHSQIQITLIQKSGRLGNVYLLNLYLTYIIYELTQSTKEQPLRYFTCQYKLISSLAQTMPAKWIT